jgi:predicted alpha/beta superfamily hydrolase
MKKLNLLLTFLVFAIASAQNQDDKPLAIGVTKKIHSAELNEDRTLNIYLPDGYSPENTAKYPVIYLLDGSINEDLIHIVGIVQFLTMIEKMPATIVVGIANVDRRRDFTFPTTIEKDKKDYPTTGSSTKFMAFIEKELQPFVEKNFKTNGTRTIIGQSLGGLFAVEVLTKKPSLFDNYVIVSPSLWWDNESLLNKFPLKEQPKANIFIAVGNEGKIMEGDARKLSDALQLPANKTAKIIFQNFPMEDHLTILHNSVYKALETLHAK